MFNYTLEYTPLARHACIGTVLGITARCVSVSVAVWEYGPGSVCVGFERSDTPEGDVYTRVYYQAVSEPRVSAYLQRPGVSTQCITPSHTNAATSVYNPLCTGGNQGKDINAKLR